MGFGATVGASILLVGFLYYTSVVTQGYLNAQQDLQDGVAKADERLATNRQASIAIDNKSWDAVTQELYVNVTNTGSVTFNVSRVELVVDGAVQTTSILRKTVEGRSTTVWPPDTTLFIAASSASNPDNVAIVGPNGVKDFWRA